MATCFDAQIQRTYGVRAVCVDCTGTGVFDPANTAEKATASGERRIGASGADQSAAW
ncbi:hypothetical protein [Stieleria marina]|uniref:Uncharacterized protein n=1 Tax=Stieleria marina TaxID=1930275 RepID=A0A517NWY7_9BACT|nr:hypothetical protein K239x_36340 [Planctomycetes bacterium K23_9]